MNHLLDTLLMKLKSVLLFLEAGNEQEKRYHRELLKVIPGFLALGYLLQEDGLPILMLEDLEEYYGQETRPVDVR